VKKWRRQLVANQNGKDRFESVVTRFEPVLKGRVFTGFREGVTGVEPPTLCLASRRTRSPHHRTPSHTRNDGTANAHLPLWDALEWEPFR
jgi:hypothetical protein